MTSPITTLVAILVLCSSAWGSPRELSASAAARDAKRDINSRRMKIYFAGTEAASERGLESRDVPLVRRLPRDYSLPMGCTDPQALAAITYATAYNRAVIAHLRRAKSD